MLGVLTDPVMILHAIRNQLVPDSWQRGALKNPYPFMISFLQNWYTFRGKQLLHFLFCLSCMEGSTLEVKNFLLLEKILSIKS